MTDDQGGGPLKPFWNVTAQYKSLLVYTVSFGIGPWLVDWLLAIGPPWPQSSAVSAFTSLVAMLVLIFCFSQWERLKYVSYQKMLRWLIPIAFVAIVVYISMKGAFSYNAPDFYHQEAVGFALKEEVKEVLREHPEMSVEDVFAGA